MCVSIPGADPSSRIVNDVSVSSDGAVLVVGCEDGSVVVWILDPDRPQQRYEQTPNYIMKPVGNVWEVFLVYSSPFSRRVLCVRPRSTVFVCCRPQKVLHSTMLWSHRLGTAV
jgi:WD40 repeat protein